MATSHYISLFDWFLYDAEIIPTQKPKLEVDESLIVFVSKLKSGGLVSYFVGNFSHIQELGFNITWIKTRPGDLVMPYQFG